MRKPTLYHFDIRTEIDEEKRNETKRTSSLVRSSIVFVSGERSNKKKKKKKKRRKGVPLTRSRWRGLERIGADNSWV